MEKVLDIFRDIEDVAVYRGGVIKGFGAMKLNQNRRESPCGAYPSSHQLDALSVISTRLCFSQCHSLWSRITVRRLHGKDRLRQVREIVGSLLMSMLSQALKWVSAESNFDNRDADGALPSNSESQSSSTAAGSQQLPDT